MLFFLFSFRVKFLEMENKQLQEKTLNLANQVGALERALRNLQLVCSREVCMSFKIVSFIPVRHNIMTVFVHLGIFVLCVLFQRRRSIRISSTEHFWDQETIADQEKMPDPVV